MAKPRPRPIVTTTSRSSVAPIYLAQTPSPQSRRPRSVSAIMTTIVVASVILVASVMGMSDAGSALLRGRSTAAVVAPSRLDALPGGGSGSGGAADAGSSAAVVVPAVVVVEEGELRPPSPPAPVVPAGPKIVAVAGGTMKGGAWAPPPFKAEEARPSQKRGGKSEAPFRERRKSGLPPPKVFIFTMDSLSGTRAAAARGGPAGEILVRTSLERSLKELGFAVTTVTTDEEAAASVAADGTLPFDILILDEWTMLAPGGAARPWVAARRKDVFLLSFFGLEISLLGGVKVEEAQVLAAYPSTLGASTTFLGYFLEPRWAPRPRQCEMARARLGSSTGLDAACSEFALTKAKTLRLPPLPEKEVKAFVWGKKEEYFENRVSYLEAAAKLLPLYAAFASPPSIPVANAVGHLSAAAFADKLAESKIFIGLGDPLLGPSAMEALACGATYIDPYYGRSETSPIKIRSELSRWGSQHPYLSVKVGEPYACGARLDEPIEMSACVRKAIENDLPPLIPPDFTYEGYLKRVHTIFNAWIPVGSESSQVLAAIAAFDASLVAPAPLGATAPMVETEAPPPILVAAAPAPVIVDTPSPPDDGVKIIDGVKVGTGSSTGWKGQGGRKPGTSG
jgi:hypothetical protein